MFIKNLKLKNYRNYDDIEISFNSNKILFIGKNAQGKTNLLESIFYLSNLDALRAKSDSELITLGKDFCNIKAEIKKFDIDVDLEIYINPPNRKKLKVNGINKNKSSDFISNISTVCFTTNDLLLLRGTPEDRRKWLDLAISQIFPAYSERISKYNKIKTQKNNYLKNLKGNINSDTSLLDVWNEQLAITGSNITYIRINFLHELLKTAKIKHSQISEKEDLSIFYNSCIIGDISSAEKFDFNNEFILENFKKKLEEKKLEEIIRGQSVLGPHRDDVSFYINNNDSKKYASQGQQRTIVLALKLAELQLIKDKIKTNAILLLDDVLAELDDLRQNFLLNAIGNDTQTIITSVDTLHFKEEYLKNVEIFEIKNNSITQI
ncbi:TPA: DNA replication/repair protein RecF [Candidatus Avigastranaerophilus faecigallinarum]|nr:DNA replication/repair protein RecF [Candidatus Avigastranaerophilus faecigallinarum]